MVKKKAAPKKKSLQRKKSAASKKAVGRATTGGRKKVASRKKAGTRKKAASAVRGPSTSGHSYTPGGLLVPPGAAEPVKPSRIKSGIQGASAEIGGMIQELNTIGAGVEVAEIELTVSFDAEGKFLGIGVGGATSIAVRFKPSE